MPLSLQNTIGDNYGPIPRDYRFEIPDGYSVLVGRNNAGKSSFLQLIFRELYNSNPSGRDSFALILADRSYVRNTTQPPNSFLQYNSNLWGQISAAPKTYANQQVADSDALYAVLLHRTNFIRQVNEINRYMLRLGFDEIVLKGAQIATMNEVHIIAHGAGVRAVLPILAALTSADISIVIIDEPELALEARSQKVLKEIFGEAAENGKRVIIATQSHIFLDKREPSKNYIVESTAGVSRLLPVTDRQELLNITYNLLGNSLEDLFFPSNFLIVEGSSDQVICEKVAQLLDIPADRVKIIAARGIDNIQDSFKAIRNTLVPLIAGESPYAKRVVVLTDNPPSRSPSPFEGLKSQLKERCIFLNENSIEEHLPGELYTKAGMKKADVLSQILGLKTALKYDKQGEALKELWNFKKFVSNSIASCLVREDLKMLSTIVGAIQLAAENANT